LQLDKQNTRLKRPIFYLILIIARAFIILAAAVCIAVVTNAVEANAVIPGKGAAVNDVATNAAIIIGVAMIRAHAVTEIAVRRDNSAVTS